VRKKIVPVGAQRGGSEKQQTYEKDVVAEIVGARGEMQGKKKKKKNAMGTAREFGFMGDQEKGKIRVKKNRFPLRWETGRKRTAGGGEKGFGQKDVPVSRIEGERKRARAPLPWNKSHTDTKSKIIRGWTVRLDFVQKKKSKGPERPHHKFVKGGRNKK